MMEFSNFDRVLGDATGYFVHVAQRARSAAEARSASLGLERDVGQQLHQSMI